jgi:isoleucyl-tRNA synthetase
LVLDKTDKKCQTFRVQDPFETLKNMVLMQRWYMISNANPWDNLKFDLEELLRCAENSLELYTTRIRSLVCANIDGLSTRKPKFQ